jgi:acetoin utilization protein AcuB
LLPPAPMTKPIPPIRKYMTTSPHTIGQEQTLHHAHQQMRALSVRHLPVLEGGRLVGMLTQRDLAVIEGLDGVDPHAVQVEDAMSTEVYAVRPEAPLDEVAGEMAEKKYGSAVVVQNGHVVGIFTSVDLARALVELLHGRLA